MFLQKLATKDLLLFSLIMLIWLTMRIAFLNIAFYWDEAWVYAPAIRIMAESGPSILPDAIPEFYSRGHPLLFHFLGGVWLKIFGESYISFHAFALSISTIFLMVIYDTIRKWSNGPIAIGTVSLVAFSKLFFAEAGNVLPEVLVALFGILGLRFFIEKKYGLYILFAGLMIWTKESGIVLPAALLLAFFIKKVFFDKIIILKEDLLKAGIISSPLIFFIIFLGIQYVYKGWFLFPEHTGMIELNGKTLLEKLKGLILYLVAEDKRNWITAILGLSILAGQKFSEKITVQVATFVVGILALTMYQDNTKFLGLLGFILLAVSGIKMFSRYFKDEFVSQKNLFLTLFSFLLTYIVFSVFNFFTVRYLISILPVFFFLVSFVLFHSLKDFRYGYSVVITILLIIMIPLHYNRNVLFSMASQVDYIELQHKMVKELETNKLYQVPLGVPDFVNRRILEDKYIGFLSSDSIFTKVDWDVNQKEFIIINSFDAYPEILSSGKYTKVNRWEEGKIWLEIWKKVK
ncbi:MAG: glycosyltransferase family 39 protein [Saprospiraceae bacterium]|nr:glycosyltransferase family 39 protein [Saprospiraceae bacterium]